MSMMLFACCLLAPCADPTKDSLETVKQSLAAGKAVLIDVRETSEWKRGHLKDAKHLALSRLKTGVPRTELEKTFPKGKIVYCHCASGIRSCDAADRLKALGYEVRALGQSYKELVTAGFATAK